MTTLEITKPEALSPVPAQNTKGYAELDDEKMSPTLEISSSRIEEPPKGITVFKIIKLNPGVSSLNYYCFILFSVTLWFGFAAAGSLQPLVLVNKNYYNIDEAKSGTIMSIVLIVQLVTKLLVSVPYGKNADVLGRRFMIIYGNINVFISMMLIPFQTTVFPGLILSKIILANGLAALHTVPLMADYIADESKGKASGIMVMLITIVSLLANLYLKTLFKMNFSLTVCYVSVATTVFALSSLATLGLKAHVVENKPSKTLENPLKQNLTFSTMLAVIKDALDILKGNPWLLIALTIQVLGSSDAHIFGTFMALYVKSMFPHDTDSNVMNLAINNVQIFTGVPSLVCIVLYALILDKNRHVLKLIYTAITGAIISFLCLTLVTNPYDWKLYLSGMLFGSSLPGLHIVMGTLYIKNFPAEKRGIMMGFTNMIGNIGFVLFSTISGLLYDNWRKDGPFMVAIICLAIALALVAFISKKKMQSELNMLKVVEVK